MADGVGFFAVWLGVGTGKYEKIYFKGRGFLFVDAKHTAGFAT